MSKSLNEQSALLLPAGQPLQWKRWLVFYFTYNSSTRLLFTSAIWMIYLAGQGYSPFIIGLLEMTFHLAKFVAEVPSGIFADMLGRRKSLIVYCVIAGFETLLFLVPSLPVLFIAFALSGISFAFLGGANEAVLWTLVGHADPGNEEKQAERYSKLFSFGLMLGIVFEITGTTLGGYMGSAMLTLPFICRAAVCLLGVVPLLMIPEEATDPKREKREHHHPLTHLLKGLRVVWHSPKLLGLICISGLTETCGTTIYFFVQLQLYGLGFALSSVGMIMAASSLSQFCFTAMAPWLMRKVPGYVLIPVCVMSQLCGLLMMIVSNPVVNLVGFLVFFQAATAILYPTVSTRLNEGCPDEQRATVLSFETGLFSLCMIVLFPLFGLGLTTASYGEVYSWTAMALVVGSVMVGVMVWVRLGKRFRW